MYIYHITFMDFGYFSINILYVLQMSNFNFGLKHDRNRVNPVTLILRVFFKVKKKSVFDMFVLGFCNGFQRMPANR